jgi:putative membrane-bound dehydrogenase-like protein
MPAPLSPQDSVAALATKPGLKVELVASEPLIADPVAIDWGIDGRLWVLEMGDYPNGIAVDPTRQKEVDAHHGAAPTRPGGRLKFLEDTNGDGTYDRATLFLDGLPYPTGIQCWRDGVLIAAAPDVIYAEDTNGDGRADIRKILCRGFGEGNQQHRVNGLRWGLDNWLYLGNGDSGGEIESVAPLLPESANATPPAPAVGHG